VRFVVSRDQIAKSTNMASTTNKLKLTLATYLCPSLPVELFQLLAEFLEQDLGCEVTLVYEWRASGPLPDRADPFADNTVHLGEFGATFGTSPLISMNNYRATF
jgi:hypothetical protein